MLIAGLKRKCQYNKGSLKTQNVELFVKYLPKKYMLEIYNTLRSDQSE